MPSHSLVPKLPLGNASPGSSASSRYQKTYKNMPYDEQLADRVRKLLARRKRFSEKKMFGGICFMLGGNMCCGVTSTNLMLRLGKEGAAKALEEPCTREMDFTGKPMKSMIYVDPEGYEADVDLRDWVRRAANFAASLPAK